VKLGALLTIAIVLLPAAALALPKRVTTEGPCTGCRATLPSDPDPVPLLVVLHGDWGHGPSELLHAWERHAAPKNVGLLALQCPKELGCKGSWWRWDGDPAFVVAQVDALRKKHALDDRRIWIAGWSGGATYMGLRSQTFEKSFAAFVFHGGGYPPGATCADPKAPTYFLTGDRNPLHAHVGQLRDHYTACGNEVVWNVVKGADHDGEWKALDAHGGAIFEWLVKKEMPEPKPAVATSVGEPPASSVPVVLPPPSAEPRSPPPTVPPRSGCGCTVTPAPTASAGWSVLALLVLGSLRRREQRVSR